MLSVLNAPDDILVLCLGCTQHFQQGIGARREAYGFRLLVFIVVAVFAMMCDDLSLIHI